MHIYRGHPVRARRRYTHPVASKPSRNRAVSKPLGFEPSRNRAVSKRRAASGPALPPAHAHARVRVRAAPRRWLQRPPPVPRYRGRRKGAISAIRSGRAPIRGSEGMRVRGGAEFRAFGASGFGFAPVRASAPRKGAFSRRRAAPPPGAAGGRGRRGAIRVAGRVRVAPSTGETARILASERWRSRTGARALTHTHARARANALTHTQNHAHALAHAHVRT